MNLYIYTARKKGHKFWSIHGAAYGETLKRFEKVVLSRDSDIAFICITNMFESSEDRVFKSELKLSKKQTLADMLNN